MAPIVWFYKRQQTVESSVFGAEFVSMKNGIETCRGLRYKLRMMGVTLSGPTFFNGKTCPVFTTLRGLSMSLRRSQTKFDIMQYVSLMPCESQ
jgi:hypothetical protein